MNEEADVECSCGARGGRDLDCFELVRPLKTLARPLGRLESGDGGASLEGEGMRRSSRVWGSCCPIEASRRNMSAYGANSWP